MDTTRYTGPARVHWTRALARSPLALLFSCAATTPDPTITPGVINPQVTKQIVCNTKWGLDKRFVTARMKREVFRSYGFVLGNQDPSCPCEVDHLISRELGGADDIRNLWPQSYAGKCNAHDKDRLENRLRREICNGNIELSYAQHAIATNWPKVYARYYPSCE